MLIIIIFLLWIMVMKMDYSNLNAYGNYNSEKLERVVSKIVGGKMKICNVENKKQGLKPFGFKPCKFRNSNIQF